MCWNSALIGVVDKKMSLNVFDATLYPFYSALRSYLSQRLIKEKVMVQMRGIDRVVHVCATDSKTWKVQQWPIIPCRKMIMTESKKIDFKWSAQNHLGFNTVSKFERS